MTRALRIEYPGATYHIISRGNRKDDIFKTDRDFKEFLIILQEVCERYNWILYAYCLMKNHYHLLIETVDGNLSKGMSVLNGKYSLKFNRYYDCSGHLFQSRYKAFLIEKENYLLEVIRYIILNPVNARIVKKPWQYKWSSYNEMLSEDSIINKDSILSLFSIDGKNAWPMFNEFLAQKNNFNYDKSISGKVFLGSKKFIETAMKKSKGAKRHKAIPKSSRFIDRPDLKSLFGKTRSIEKRNEIIYDCHVKYGYSFREISIFLKLHYSTISKAFAKIKNRKSGGKSNNDKFKPRH